jgi:cell division transport system permease protein
MKRSIGHYLGLHRQNLFDALRRVISPGNLLTVFVIAIALALPAGLGVLLNNVRALSASWEGAADFTVYLADQVTEPAARELAERVGQRADVAQVLVITRDEALAEFRRHSGFGEALDALPDNPLPHLLVVRPATTPEADVEALAAALDALPETELVQIDTTWVNRLRAMLGLARRIVDVAAILLGLAVTLVIGNTIRLEIHNRRQEIEVTKLVGASDAFVRRPFLYLGLLYGLIGAAVAAALVEVAMLGIGAPVRALAMLYGSGFRLAGLSLAETGLLLAAGAGLGWAGAGFAAARRLRAIEPR